MDADSTLSLDMGINKLTQLITPKIRMVDNGKGGKTVTHVADAVEPDSLLMEGAESQISYGQMFREWNSINCV